MNEQFERKITEMQARRAASVDGFQRPPEAEEKINLLCATVLNSPGGERLLDYMRSISTNVVAHPNTSDAELRMLEGMRRMVGILDNRRRAPRKAE